MSHEPAGPPSSPAAVDRRGRPLHDLRISVTDRCNFRCGYCMPRSQFGPGFRFLPPKEILSFEEVARIAHLAVGLGVRKLRITGGEPLLRRDLPVMLAMLPRQRPSGEPVDLAMTTNGSLLARHAEALRRAGLRRVTVSLDSLDEREFTRLSDSNVPVTVVLEGIEAARRAGLGVKVNAVIRRGVNDGGMVELARYFHEQSIPLRLIEFMDVGNSNDWRLGEVLTAAEMLERIGAQLPLEPLDSAYRGEVARRYRYLDGRGELGVIASVSQPFCGDCTRARLSAQGRLYTCLFAADGLDLRARLRSGVSDEELRGELGRLWSERLDAYSERRGLISLGKPSRKKIEMSYIGG